MVTFWKISTSSIQGEQTNHALKKWGLKWLDVLGNGHTCRKHQIHREASFTLTNSPSYGNKLRETICPNKSCKVPARNIHFIQIYINTISNNILPIRIQLISKIKVPLTLQFFHQSGIYSHDSSPILPYHAARCLWPYILTPQTEHWLREVFREMHPPILSIYNPIHNLLNTSTISRLNLRDTSISPHTRTPSSYFIR